MRKVSYCDEQLWRHVKQETIRNRFSVGMNHRSAMPNRKPFANSFLLV